LAGVIIQAAVSLLTQAVMRIICAILCFAASFCVADSIEPAVVFKDLDGIARRPLEPAGKLASVLIFYGYDCPISNAYAPAINRLCASQTNFAFYVVQVDPDLTLTAARLHAQEYALRPPVLLDPQHRLVKLFKATVTPETVVLGKNGEVLYRGRIDDRNVDLGKHRDAATQHDLTEALNAIAAGQPVKQKETKPIGCLIQ
jgi:AhpC/TSA family